MTLSALLLGFWLGGMVAVALQIMGEPVPELARLAPVRFALALVGIALCWPAAFVLRYQHKRRSERECAEEAEQDAAIEKMRQTLALVVRVKCPKCGGFHVTLEPSEGEAEVLWVCLRCGEIVSVPVADCERL